MKHAYLIMAHGNWKILKILLMLLDDEKNDIYLHVDSKSKMPDEIKNVLKKSKFIKIKAIKCYWADFTQVKVTINLLKAAVNAEEQYSYYHLLSGVDLPIKSNKERYDYFESSGKEFIGIVPKEVYYSVRRVQYYHILLHNTIYRKSYLLKGIDRILEYIQKVAGINRLKDNNWKIIDGWTWFSITDDFCRYVLDKERLIYKIFSYSIASDELFIQTLIYNSPYYEKIYDKTDLKKGSMRHIDWERGKPYIWGQEEGDFENLMRSPFMFARKFDEKYFEIVEQIYEEIDRRNRECIVKN
ncbi:beta-1,6-N-acetylglucosaminyltransferase [Sellimonas catena]|uniref:Peptide O-xylosyltransferase n=1 Tax=Sellimonas catena TaxID=2994035 RepID=A0A9W6FH76_9FIRM|nr:beta-1,6-N-acetylglucosaminyltransferase [Sellimonas catena]GLG91701.1 glycosyl transferase [Sellimonas catena]